MPGTILSVALGATKTRIARIYTGLKQIRIDRFAEAPGPDFSDLEQTARDVRQVIESEKLQSDYFVLGFDGSHCFFRHLFFPFPKKEKIRQVLDFELEPSLPFETQEFLTAFFKTGQQKDHLHGILAAAMETQTMDTLLQAFQAVGLDPDEVIPDVSSLPVFLQEFQINSNEDTLILDIEESWANLVYCRQGRPLYFRSFSLFSPGPPEAEPAHGKTESDHEPPEDSIAPHSTAEAQTGTALVKDIELTLLAAGTSAQGAALSNLLLLGEKTLEQREMEALESAFQVPVLSINDCIPSQCYAREDLSASAAQFTTALALALQCKTKNSGLNFRQGLYAKQTAYTKWKRPLLYAGAACSALFISWMATLGFDIVLLEKKNAHIENKVHTVFYRTLPEINKKYLPSQYASIIQSKIDALQNRSALYSSQGDQLKLLDALKIFHSFIPDQANVSFEYLVLDSKRIMINGIANSFNTIEDLKNTLLRANEFNAVNIKGAKSSNQGQSINFSLEIETNV